MGTDSNAQTGVAEDARPPVENEHLLTARFGFWPSFHDAEIIRARLERRGADAPWLELEIHVVTTAGEVDAKGYFIVKDQALVTLRFCDIVLDELTDWNGQNVLFGLYITRAPPVVGEQYDWRPIGVEFPSSYGCAGKLTCRTIKVVTVAEWVGD